MMAGQLPPYLAPFQLLELNIISAQELCRVARTMKTYAIAWVHPDRKLSSRVDTNGNVSPTWNDKFVFRVDDAFLQNERSAVMIEIYAHHWWRDTLVGTVRVLVSNVIPPTNRLRQSPGCHQVGTRFVALQVRRPSGRPQGILNIGLGLLDSSMRSVPLYSQISSSAVGYRDLMGEGGSLDHSHDQFTHFIHNYHHQGIQNLRPELRQVKSNAGVIFEGGPSVISSESESLNIKREKENSGYWVTGSMREDKGTVKQETVYNPNVAPLKGIICKPQLRREPSMKRVTIEEPKKEADREAMNSEIAVSSKPMLANEKKEEKVSTNENGETNKRTIDNGEGRVIDGKSQTRHTLNMTTLPPPPPHTPLQKLDFEKGSDVVIKPFVTDSELGLSPSEVAIAVAKASKCQSKGDKAGSGVGGWSLVSSTEGLRSKLERWYAEQPPIYDVQSDGMSYVLSEAKGESKKSKLKGRHKKDEVGAFTCFGNMCGIQCTIVCGSKVRGIRKKGAKPTS